MTVDKVTIASVVVVVCMASFSERARAVRSISSALASAISATLRGSGSSATSSWNARTMRSYRSPSTLSRLSSGRHAGVATWRSRPSPLIEDRFKTAVATSTSVTFTSRWLANAAKTRNKALRATRSARAPQSLSHPFLTRMMHKLLTR